MVRIAPSILSADFAALAAEVAKVEREADWLHVDVMDGHFVPNLTIGPPVVAALRPHSGLYFDCHLMMTNPGDYLEAFRRAGANGCSVHVEVGQTEALLKEMRALGLDAGLAVNPETPFEVFEPFLERVDVLVLMTVHPGFAGQEFIHEVVPKLARTRAEIERRGLTIALEVDGGIDEHTGPVAAAAGADVFVAGSAIFGRPKPSHAARLLRRSVEHARQHAGGGQAPGEKAQPGNPRPPEGRSVPAAGEERGRP